MLVVPNSGETLYGVPPPIGDGTKCEHGIYIPNGDDFAHYCSICQFNRGVVVGCAIPRNKALGDLDAIYADYVKDNNRANSQYLYSALLIFAGKVARRFNRNMGDLDYAISDAAAAVYLQLPKYKGDSKFTTWAFAVVYRSLIDHQRAEELPYTNVDLDEAANMPAGGLPIDTKLYFAELLGNLTPLEREVFDMHAQGFTHEEVAEQLKVSVSTAKRYWYDVEETIIGAV